MAESFAVISGGVVKNIIIAEKDYSPDDVEVVEYSNSTFCQPGMFYNQSDGLFYDDETFTKINQSN